MNKENINIIVDRMVKKDMNFTDLSRATGIKLSTLNSVLVKGNDCRLSTLELILESLGLKLSIKK